MTRAKEILTAAIALTRSGADDFSRAEVRDPVGLTGADSLSGYTAIFQGMRDGRTGGALCIGQRYAGVFQRVPRVGYVLTSRGRQRM